MGIFIKVLLFIFAVVLTFQFAKIVFFWFMNPFHLILLAAVAVAIFMIGAMWSGFRHGSGEHAWQGGLDLTGKFFNLVLAIPKMILRFVFGATTKHKFK